MSEQAYLYILMTLIGLEAILILSQLALRPIQYLSTVGLIALLLIYCTTDGNEFFVTAQLPIQYLSCALLGCVLLWLLVSKESYVFKMLQVGHVWLPIYMSYPAYPQQIQALFVFASVLWIVILSEILFFHHEE